MCLNHKGMCFGGRGRKLLVLQFFQWRVEVKREREEGGGENELLFWECDKKELRSIKERKEKKYGR